MQISPLNPHKQRYRTRLPHQSPETTAKRPNPPRNPFFKKWVYYSRTSKNNIEADDLFDRCCLPARPLSNALVCRQYTIDVKARSYEATKHTYGWNRGVPVLGRQDPRQFPTSPEENSGTNEVHLHRAMHILTQSRSSPLGRSFHVLVGKRVGTLVE